MNPMAATHSTLSDLPLRRRARTVGQRRCIACHQVADKHSLIRLECCDKHLVIKLNETENAGRGYYICGRRRCFEIAVKRRKLNRLLQSPSTLPSLDTLVSMVIAAITRSACSLARQALADGRAQVAGRWQGDRSCYPDTIWLGLTLSVRDANVAAALSRWHRWYIDFAAGTEKMANLYGGLEESRQDVGFGVRQAIELVC